MGSDGSKRNEHECLPDEIRHEEMDPTTHSC